ncbi:hypothetical protein B0J15DRAFT_538603 [Fusarium solani]|uniref:DUF6536 domain-containing protein n=1 Tax=Fusarium solani TaxID=169388 RepID=A0A9P9GG36_FUSSL|nr:uncharacterized protein B0J15DRAFT_538603 [Fusarium solani]KAH7237307.1 hypothetical protein B0J15DRAFT_538603 [Fusarium solani]
MLHIILAIWIPTLDSFHNGISVLWTGNCQTAVTYNTILRAGTTAIATLLIGGSNYCMQCLTAPTRKDLQTAHNKGIWLDVGVQSIRNLKIIKGYKAVLWLLVVISSIPIHLFIPRNATRYLDGIKTAQSRPGSAEQNDIGEFKRLSVEECIDAYARPVVSGRRTVIITTSNETEKSPFAFGYEYIAGEHSIPYIAKQPSGWAPSFLPVKYCHSEIVEENCALNANQPIVIVIIICNSIKLIIIKTMVFWVKGWPIITLRDAIQSFLNDPDPTTEGLCLLSKDANEPTDAPDPVMAGRRHRWSDAASTRRWFYAPTILGTSLMGMIIFFGLSIDLIKDNNIVNPFSIGFGSVDAAAVVTYRSVPTSTKYRYRILAAVVVANLPQMIFSIIIFSLNNLLTVIYTAQEWEGFSRQRKTLRVSEPKGEQRSTYFLQLPYRIAVPFNVATGDVEVTACGFSPWPMVLAIAVGVVLIAGVRTFFFFRFASTMPMVGTCSAAISAACHHDDGQEEVALKPVKWGAVFVPETEGQEWIGHCCFTSSLVKRPKPERFYAGGGAAYRGK